MGFQLYYYHVQVYKHLTEHLVGWAGLGLAYKQRRRRRGLDIFSLVVTGEAVANIHVSDE